MKKYLSLALAAAMALSLAACGGSGSAANSEPAASAPASSVTPIKIGGTGPLTGLYSNYGTAAKNGAQIAVDEVNALGGDIQFELNYQDEEGDAEKAVNAYNSLKDWGMQIFLGSVTSGAGAATAIEASNDRIFYLTPSASATAVVGGIANALTGSVDVGRNDVAFQMCFVDPKQGAASAQYIKDKNLGTKIGVIYQNDIDYSVGIYQSFMAKAAEIGLEVDEANVTTFTKDSQTDFSVQIAALQKAGVDLVFLPIYYSPASMIFTQANQAGYKPTYFGVDGMDGILEVEGFDASLAEGVMMLTPFSADSEDEKTAAFVAKYQEQFGETPIQFAADAYDCIWAIYDALQDSGLSAASTAKEFCDYLVPLFAGDFTFDGITGKGMDWDETGTVNKAPMGVVIKEGVYVGLD